MNKAFYHQQKVIDFIKNDTNKGVLVFHSVGSGKTLTAILSAKAIIDKYPNKTVLVATPASLITNFKQEISKFPVEFQKKVRIESYQKMVNILVKGESICRDTILIIDEAHNINGGGEIYKSLYKCGKKAFKIILLSATPVKNDPSEISKQFSILEGQNVPAKVVGNIANLANKRDQKMILDRFFKCKVSFYENKGKLLSDYPIVAENVVKFEMSPEYYEDYMKIEKGITKDAPLFLEDTRNLTVFFNGIRRGVNLLHEPSAKFVWIANTILENLKQGKKVLIYSNWIKGGIEIVKKMLNKSTIAYSEVTGSMTKEVKQKNVDKFNKSITKILLISASGSEGLNLKEVRTVIIMEPHWNRTRIDQVIGRASRFKSHALLPPDERKVDIYHLLLEKPSKKEIRIPGDTVPSADILLFDKSNVKQVEISKFYKTLIPKSIENDSDCGIVKKKSFIKRTSISKEAYKRDKLALDLMKM